MARRYRRFTISDRLEHVAQITAFTALAVSGLVQRYHEATVSQWLIDLFGGIEAVRVFHRVFATILMVAIVYHVAAIGYRKFVQKRPRQMLPSKADIKAAAHSMRYLAGREQAPPRQGHFTWEEKVEYFALVWGTLVMVATGFLLWNPIATAKMLPGQFIPAAKVFHSGEALLAVLAVIVWHMYHVHVRSFNTSIFTGYMSRDHMLDDHALELEEIEAGLAFQAPRDSDARRRARIFIPAFAGIAAVMVAGIYLFVTFEETAIDTIEPPEQVEAFAPVETSGTTSEAPTTTGTEPATTTTDGTATTEGTATTDGPASTSTTGPPATTLAPAGGAWDDTISALLFDQGCTDCHGATALGGVTLSTYEGTAAVVVPGEPDGSPLVEVQEAGGHPGQLDDAAIAAVREWILSGAPETGDGEAPPPPTAASWDSTVMAMVSSCTGCHGSASPMAGVDLTTHESTLAAVVSGDPDGSPLYTSQAAGGHPGQLSDEDLAVLREWIVAGAP